MDRPRCLHCRNPLKPHQATSGPPSGEGSYHQDCWAEAAAQVAVDFVAQRAERQQEYQRQIASQGLAALLSPYVSSVPQQRETGLPAGPALAI